MTKRILFAVGLFCTLVAMTTFSIADAKTDKTPKTEVMSEKIDEGMPAGKININTADMDELQQLPGIGEKTAANIKNYIEKNGKFTKAGQLLKVKNIGEKTLERIKPFIKLK